MTLRMTSVVAIAVGPGVALTVPVIAGLFFGESLIPFYCVIVTQGIFGFILSLTWPQLTWRAGVWMFAIWPAILLFAIILAGPPTKSEELYEALTYLWILFSGCVGAWTGAFIARRFKRNTQVKSFSA
jgi:hypothetical protein